jgi:protein gp37/ParB-like chromosome segregation protein Spo0J
VARLSPHPDNPRLGERIDVIEAIAAGLASGFDPAHALIVRPLGGGWQIVSGHHRWSAAKRAGLDRVPCWVRELDDATAYMMLVTSNAQSELTALEHGLHALHSVAKPEDLDVKAYAASVGREKEYQTVRHEVMAARVASAVLHVYNDLGDLAGHFRVLVEIHAAPEWLWPALVEAMLPSEATLREPGGTVTVATKRAWTVEETRARVVRFKNISEPPFYLDIAEALIAGIATPADIDRVIKAEARTIAELDAIARRQGELEGYEADPLAGTLQLFEGSMSMDKPYFGTYAEALEYFDAVVARCRQNLAGVERLHREAQRATEAARARSLRLLNYVALEEWQTLDQATQLALLPPAPSSVSKATFNPQESREIEWAKWSWNPITGCEHTCPYCYAREIANDLDRAKVFPNGFAPTLKPRSLLAPRFMKVPDKAKTDARFRNVFMGSMADVFGRWVPTEWIEAILTEIRAAPQWNFLCLTKFPKRMAEFDIPANCWMGTTVDLQARVAAAEAGFEHVGSKIRWLSIEPMLEPLQFTHLERFHWMVIGGASSTKNDPPTPEWRPPFDWIVDVVQQARDAGVAVYMKTNLLGNRILELPGDLPIEADPLEAPAVFHYLQQRKAVPGGEGRAP